MDIDAVIQQLRTAAPFFVLVGGAADYEVGLKSTTYSNMPAAFVLPMKDDPEPNTDMGGSYHQWIVETIGVVVIVDNTADRRGQTAAEDMKNARAALFAALIQWMPDPENQERGFKYVDGGLLDFDRARLKWQFDFSVRTLITDADGWQPPGVPLTDIQLSRTETPFTPIAHADLTGNSDDVC